MRLGTQHTRHTHLFFHTPQSQSKAALKHIHSATVFPVPFVYAPCICTRQLQRISIKCIKWHNAHACSHLRRARYATMFSRRALPPPSLPFPLASLCPLVARNGMGEPVRAARVRSCLKKPCRSSVQRASPRRPPQPPASTPLRRGRASEAALHAPLLRSAGQPVLHARAIFALR